MRCGRLSTQKPGFSEKTGFLAPSREQRAEAVVVTEVPGLRGGLVFASLDQLSRPRISAKVVVAYLICILLWRRVDRWRLFAAVVVVHKRGQCLLWW